MSEEEYDNLVRQAHQAHTDNDVWTAGLLYERAYQLAVEHGWKQEAFDTISRAAESFTFSADPDRGLRLLLDARGQLESLTDAEGRYWLQALFLLHAIDEELTVGDLDQHMAHLSELAVRAWGAEGGRTHYLRSMLLDRRGEWEKGLEAAARAWTDRDGPGAPQNDSFCACVAVHHCLRLGRRAEAERWRQLLHATADAPSGPSALADCFLAKYDNDTSAARAASRQLDALVNPELPDSVMAATEEAVYALVLDADEGDPAGPTHLVRLRLTHQPLTGPLRFWFRYDYHRALACLELAGVRHAAGMHPVDDYFYATPQTLPRPEDARLPDELLPRLAAFDRACDTALRHALEADTRFTCSRRQQDVADLRQRGADIAAVFHP